MNTINRQSDMQKSRESTKLGVYIRESSISKMNLSYGSLYRENGVIKGYKWYSGV